MRLHLKKIKEYGLHIQRRAEHNAPRGAASFILVGVYTSVQVHVHFCTCACTKTYMCMYRSVHNCNVLCMHVQRSLHAHAMLVACHAKNIALLYLVEIPRGQRLQAVLVDSQFQFIARIAP